MRALAGGLPRPFWFLWAGTFVTRAGGFVVPFMAIYLTAERGIPLPTVGLVLSLYGAGGAIAAPLGGYLADHVGRRATMLAGLVLGGAGMIALGFADRIEVIGAIFFLTATFGEMYRPGMSAAIADLVPPADRARAYGLIYWVINLGFAIGLALGGLLAGISFTWLFVGDGLTTLLFAVLIWRGVPETLHTHAAPAADRPKVSGWQGFLTPYRDAPFVGFIVLNFVLWVVFMQNSTTFPIDTAAHGVPRATFGLILGLNGLVIVLVQPLLGPFLARRDRSRSLALGSALVGIGFGLNALFHTPLLYALGVVVWTVGEICVLPVASTVVADVAPRHMRGRYQGASGLGFGLATCLAPLLGTLVFERFGSATLWLACLVLGGAVAAGHLLLGTPLRRLRDMRMAA